MLVVIPQAEGHHEPQTDHYEPEVSPSLPPVLMETSDATRLPIGLGVVALSGPRLAAWALVLATWSSEETLQVAL